MTKIGFSSKKEQKVSVFFWYDQNILQSTYSKKVKAFINKEENPIEKKQEQTSLADIHGPKLRGLY